MTAREGQNTNRGWPFLRERGGISVGFLAAVTCLGTMALNAKTGTEAASGYGSNNSPVTSSPDPERTRLPLRVGLKCIRTEVHEGEENSKTLAVDVDTHKLSPSQAQKLNFATSLEVVADLQGDPNHTFTGSILSTEVKPANGIIDIDSVTIVIDPSEAGGRVPCPVPNIK
ncbi:MAG TPA: hypothetical protein VMY99_03845 [Nevskiaceae bacterium]|nr:hypothetical protein [Nevskiaceae bacterium]